MARLCRKADIVVPNMTEACHLLSLPYDPGPYSRAQVEGILRGLCALGPQMAVLTGVWLEEGSLGSACYDARSGEMDLFLTGRVAGSYHGTGDLFAAALLGRPFERGLPRSARLYGVYLACHRDHPPAPAGPPVRPQVRVLAALAGRGDGGASRGGGLPGLKPPGGAPSKREPF